ncbi:hypothetical protein [Ornithinibacillus scapharcae]|uniref:hypothetical protein n=1 Tax=Ornithinibacillus scapharcae TaxID=1147159 RepID=UPI000225C189|nr:hypothetical protein [Ornithinibacillus scapharcae]
MRIWNNEKGAALVMTVMVITLILLFVMALFFQITNTTKQIQKGKSITVAEQIAAMGVDYYQTYVKENLPTIYEAEDEVRLPDIRVGEKFNLDDSGNYKFWFADHSLNRTSESEMNITFTSIGEANGEVEEIESSIMIQIESGE